MTEYKNGNLKTVRKLLSMILKDIEKNLIGKLRKKKVLIFISKGQFILKLRKNKRRKEDN